MYSLLLALLFSSVSDAGSICNDGTYSHSEGRGTCSWHGGVATSGVYPEQSSSYRDADAVKAGSHPEWSSHYGTTSDGVPVHYIHSSDLNSSSSFGYACYIQPHSLPGERLLVSISMGVIDYDITLASQDLIKVFAHTNTGYKLISGSWVFDASDGILYLEKTNKMVKSLAEPLSKTDMAHILLSDHILVSIKGYEDVKIRTPGVASKIPSTWSKCNASYNTSAK